MRKMTMTKKNERRKGECWLATTQSGMRRQRQKRRIVKPPRLLACYNVYSCSGVAGLCLKDINEKAQRVSGHIGCIMKGDINTDT